MPRVVWTEEAEDQLAGVSSDELVEELLALAAGLGRLPERGRRVPELRGRPAHDIVRELILPHKARVFYLHIPDSDEVIILGLLLRGRLFSQKVLGRYFESD
jgi:plasmid stabilization system protein ParE